MDAVEAARACGDDDFVVAVDLSLGGGGGDASSPPLLPWRGGGGGGGKGGWDGIDYDYDFIAVLYYSPFDLMFLILDFCREV